MIKNYRLVKELEAEYNSRIKTSLDERFKLIDEMYLFWEPFERTNSAPEDSPHVKMLVNLTKAFRKIKVVRGD